MRLFPRPSFGSALLWGSLTVIALAALVGGVHLRAQVFGFTQPIRYGRDLQNAYRHGTNVIRLAREEQGLDDGTLPTWLATFRAALGFYDRILAGWPTPGYSLDYPPMRLLVMTIWSRSIYDQARPPRVDELPACGPLLTLNSFMAGLAAVFAGWLTAHWVRRGIGADVPSRRPLWTGVIAALMVWFDFAVLIDAHAWPQWDVWLLPFFFGSLLVGSYRRWMTAGLVFGLGAMLKGQLLVVAPLLILWPLLAGFWSGLIRVIVGLLLSVALIEGMWVALSPLSLLLAGSFLTALTAAGIYWRARLRRHLHLMVGSGAALLLIAALLGGASFGWVRQGFAYGAQRRENSLASPGANNLGQLLQMRYGWSSTSDPLTSASDLTVGRAMQIGYGVCLLACAIALARHDRRNDVRALAAMAAPWVLFYALMPQMSGRYLVWGAAATSLLAGIDVGCVLLHLVISVSSALTIVLVLFLYSGNAAWWPALAEGLRQAHPGLAWVTLLCAGITLYLACSPTPRRDQRVRARPVQ